MNEEMTLENHRSPFAVDDQQGNGRDKAPVALQAPPFIIDSSQSQDEDSVIEIEFEDVCDALAVELLRSDLIGSTSEWILAAGFQVKCSTNERPSEKGATLSLH